METNTLRFASNDARRKVPVKRHGRRQRSCTSTQVDVGGKKRFVVIQHGAVPARRADEGKPGGWSYAIYKKAKVVRRQVTLLLARNR